MTPRYNGQMAVDDTVRIIVAAEVSKCAADLGPLVPMLRAVNDNTGQAPERASINAVPDALSRRATQSAWLQPRQSPNSQAIPS